MHIAIDLLAYYELGTGDCWRTEAFGVRELLTDHSAKKIGVSQHVRASGDLALGSAAVSHGKSASNPKNRSATTKGIAATARASTISVAGVCYLAPHSDFLHDLVCQCAPAQGQRDFSFLALADDGSRNMDHRL
jgi:hypothetical protein